MPEETRCIQKTTAPGHANADRKQLQPDFKLKVVDSLIRRSSTALKFQESRGFSRETRLPAMVPSQPRLALGKNSCWTMPFFPKVRFGFLRQLLRIDFQQRKNERGAGFFDSSRVSRAEECGMGGFVMRSHSQECASTCFLSIEVYDHALTNLSFSFLFQSIPITSPQ
jgi:hypothetical protein